MKILAIDDEQDFLELLKIFLICSERISKSRGFFITEYTPFSKSGVNSFSVAEEAVKITTFCFPMRQQMLLIEQYILH